MNTFTVWLLVSFTLNWGSYDVQPSVVDRFWTRSECQRVQKVMEETDKRVRLRCIERSAQ